MHLLSPHRLRASRNRSHVNEKQWETHVETNGQCSYHLLKVKKDWNDSSDETVIPLPRSGHRMVSDGTYLYSLGGLVHSDQVHTNHPNFRGMEVRAELFRFHILTQRWQKIPLNPPLKNLTASHAMSKIGRHLLVHGGTGIPFGRIIDNNVYLIDIQTGETHVIPCSPKEGREENSPIPSYGQSLTAIPDRMPGHYKIYRIFGTIGTEYLTEVYCLHWPEAEWELVWSHGVGTIPLNTELVNSRYRHSSFLIDDEIWVVGGAPLFDGEPGFKSIDIFCPLSHSWRCIHCDVSRLDPNLVESGMPVFNSVERLGDYIYLVGGSDPLTELPSAFNHVLMLSVRTYTWYPISLKWSVPAYFSASCPGPCGDEIYIFGGVTQPNAEYQRCNTLWRMHFPFHDVPPLIELAWRVFSRRMQQYGIPKESQSPQLEVQLRKLCDYGWYINTEKRSKLSSEDVALITKIPRICHKRLGWPLEQPRVVQNGSTGQEPRSSVDLEAG